MGGVRPREAGIVAAIHELLTARGVSVKASDKG